MSDTSPTNYRALFHDMPRLTGGTDVQTNKAVAYIAERLECDLRKAKSVYDQIRKAERKILVFDNITREWMGITVWQQTNTTLNMARTATRLMEENQKVLMAILRVLCKETNTDIDEALSESAFPEGLPETKATEAPGPLQPPPQSPKPPPKNLDWWREPEADATNPVE